MNERAYYPSTELFNQDGGQILEVLLMRVEPHTREFILFCFLTGLLNETPQPKISVKTNWERDLQLCMEYLMTDASTGDLAQKFGVSRQRVSIVINTTFKKIWESSPILQERFPQHEDFNFIKVKGKGDTKDEVILARIQERGGIHNLTEKDFDELNINLYQRQRLADRYGVIIPDLSSIRREALRSKIRDTHDKETLSKLLTETEIGLRTAVELTKGEEPVLVFFKDAFSQFLRKNNKEISQILTAASIPFLVIEIGEVYDRTRQYTYLQKYYFIPKQFVAEAQRTIIQKKNNLSYKHEVTYQISGEKVSELPTLFQFSDKSQFLSLRVFLENAGFKVRGWKPHIRVGDIIQPDCPIPVFKRKVKSGFTYFFPTKYQEALVAYLEKRRAELL